MDGFVILFIFYFPYFHLLLQTNATISLFQHYSNNEKLPDIKKTALRYALWKNFSTHLLAEFLDKIAG